MKKVLIFAVFAVGALFGPLSGTAHADTASDESAFLADINALRARVGVGPLSVDSQLTSIARSWSQQMADAGGISHNPSLKDLVTSLWTKLGENVGMGPSEATVFTAFVNSPHHYANLVDPDFNYVGVGVVWKGNTMYTSHEFMKVKTSSGGGGTTPPPTSGGTTPTTRRTTPTPKPVVTTPTTPKTPVSTTTTTIAVTINKPTDRLRNAMQQLRGFDPARR
jgi:hypothetical protein